MNHISLFSGIGGFDLAAEWMGWNNVASCEINPFGRKVLEYYWPDALHHDDVHTFTKSLLDEKKENWNSNDVILTGGFPCQPYSNAGKRLGKEDERHLWPEMLRVIREVQPSWIVGENVRGLVNWNGGMVFDEVQSDLEAIGFEVLPFLLPACAKNAPHRRDRIWFVAYSNGAKSGNNGKKDEGTSTEIRRENAGYVFGEFCGVGDVTNAEKSRSGGELFEQPQKGEFRGQNSGISSNANGGGQSGKEHRETKTGFNSKTGLSIGFENFPTEPPICGGNDGLPSKLDGITFPKWRNESIKAFGNAVVPQVVFEIFKAIEKFNNGIQ